MGIYSRLREIGDLRLPAHEFAAILRIYVLDVATGAQALAALNEVTADRRTDPPTLFPLVGDEITDVQAIKLHYDTLGSAAARAEYLAIVESVLVLSQVGAASGYALLTENQMKNLLGI